MIFFVDFGEVRSCWDLELGGGIFFVHLDTRYTVKKYETRTTHCPAAGGSACFGCSRTQKIPSLSFLVLLSLVQDLTFRSQIQ